MRKVTSSLIALLTLAAAVFLACGEEDVTKPTPTPTANTTPANCLRVVEASWCDKDYDRFAPCLSPNFVFYFNPNDVGQNVGGYTIPVSWNAAEMKDAIRNMLTQAYSITMDIPAENIKQPASGATTFRTSQVVLELQLLTAPATGYRIGAGYCIFEFEKYKVEGEDRWRLTKWWDYTRESRAFAAGVGKHPASLGRVLCAYR